MSLIITESVARELKIHESDVDRASCKMAECDLCGQGFGALPPDIANPALSKLASDSLHGKTLVVEVQDNSPEARGSFCSNTNNVKACKQGSRCVKLA